MNRVGVIVDVAHSGWRTSLEAAQVSERPMVASHSVCCALNVHHRGKPDEVIRAIADSGGYIGICCVPAFLGGSGDINALLDHIDHVAKTFGVDHVAIGTDVAYSSSRSGEEYAKILPRRRTRAGWEHFWPADDPLYDPQWQQEHQRLSLAWTNWPLFTVGLVQRGYSDDDIQKILGGNVLRVARAVWPMRP
jgi:membrane dipeptidase